MSPQYQIFIFSLLGSIGITLAPYVKRVVGLEQISQAVEDAKYNAALNGWYLLDFTQPSVTQIITLILSTIKSFIKVIDRSVNMYSSVGNSLESGSSSVGDLIQKPGSFSRSW